MAFRLFVCCLFSTLLRWLFNWECFWLCIEIVVVQKRQTLTSTFHTALQWTLFEKYQFHSHSLNSVGSSIEYDYQNLYPYWPVLWTRAICELLYIECIYRVVQQPTLSISLYFFLFSTISFISLLLLDVTLALHHRLFYLASPLSIFHSPLLSLACALAKATTHVSSIHIFLLELRLSSFSWYVN